MGAMDRRGDFGTAGAQVLLGALGVVEAAEIGLVPIGETRRRRLGAENRLRIDVYRLVSAVGSIWAKDTMEM